MTIKYKTCFQFTDVDGHICTQLAPAWEKLLNYLNDSPASLDGISFAEYIKGRYGAVYQFVDPIVGKEEGLLFETEEALLEFQLEWS